MANEESKPSATQPAPTAKKDEVTIRATIEGVGLKVIKVPAAQVEKTLEKIARVGFAVDNKAGGTTYYMPAKIEKIDVIK